MTGLPSTFGSRRAMRLASLMAETSLTTLTIGTGQNRPPGGLHLLGDASASARFMKPVERVEVAAAQHHGVGGRGRADDDRGQALGLLEQRLRASRRRSTYSGFSLSEPCGLIISWLLGAFLVVDSTPLDTRARSISRRSSRQSGAAPG